MSGTDKGSVLSSIVCNHFGIGCMSLFGMIKEEGVDILKRL